MSPDFLRFFQDYNAARTKHGLEPADDWFSFSVPEMFRAETSSEAWAYWRWRALRARVAPGQDYRELARLVAFFGEENTFVQTSNCDQLHAAAGLSSDRLWEIHGSLARLQCSGPCCTELWPADAAFLERLEREPAWVPMCPRCAGTPRPACLRPNVMIFGDHKLVSGELDAQEERLRAYTSRLVATASVADGGGHNWVVLEVGAGVVVPSIRHDAEALGLLGRGLIRVNPSPAECATMQSVDGLRLMQKAQQSPTGPRCYWPLPLRSSDALKRICDMLQLPPAAQGER
jgi:hypothetical protein